MEAEAIDQLDRIVDVHWWHIGRRRVVTELARRHWNGHNTSQTAKPLILDVGCGVGDYGNPLSAFTQPVGIERSAEGIQCARRRGYPHLVRADARSLPVRSNSVEGLMALDLLEHVVEDEAVLREYFRCLRPGGILLATVPAHPWMWSDLDVRVGHVRRYRKTELARKIRAAGFGITKLSYFNSVLFPVMASIRLVQRAAKRWVDFDSTSLEPPRQAWVNHALAACFGSEARWLRWRRFPFGVSLVCLAQKPLEIRA